MSNIRQQVLQSFKKLHRTRTKVFAGDEKALTAARIRINEEYSKNKYVKEEEAIRAMIQYGDDVANEMKKQIIQLQETKPGVYKAKITEETLKLENIPYNKTATIEEASGQNTPCCQNRTVK